MEILFIFYKPVRCGRLSLVICIEIQRPRKACQHGKLILQLGNLAAHLVVASEIDGDVPQD